VGTVAHLPREFAPGRHALEVSGNNVRYLGRQFEGGKLVHYRGYKSDLKPVQKRVEAFANARPSNWKSEYEYIGSVDRVVIHDWLMKRGKTWHEFATDRDLRGAFMSYYRAEYSKMMASSYQERRMTINRTKHSQPRLGERILSAYRKETAQP